MVLYFLDFLKNRHLNNSYLFVMLFLIWLQRYIVKNHNLFEIINYITSKLRI